MNKCVLEERDAQDRRQWRRMVQDPDPAPYLDKVEEEER